jgi:hypothetical protein
MPAPGAVLVAPVPSAQWQEEAALLARIRPINVPPSLRPEECGRWLQLKDEERAQAQRWHLAKPAPPADPRDEQIRTQIRAILLSGLEDHRRKVEDLAATATNGAARATFYALYLRALFVCG